MGWGQFSWPILTPHIPVGRFSCSPVAGILGNKLVTLRGPLLPMFIYVIFISFGAELNYIISYLVSLLSAPYKHPSGHQKCYMDSLTFLQMSVMTKGLLTLCSFALMWLSICGLHAIGPSRP
jgi:hypothetical protein